MVHQNVSSQAIIARVYRDLKPTATNWMDDAVEWLGDVVERIQVYCALERKTQDLVVKHHKAALPCDLESVLAVAFPNEQGIFHPLPVSNRTSNEVLFSGELWRAEVDACIRANQPYVTFAPGIVRCSFESGTLRLHYYAFPLDEQGFPLIPDNYYYKTAAFWYIASRLALRGDLKLDFDRCDAEWQRYAQLAANDCAFPSPERMERFGDRWRRILPPAGYQERFDPERLPPL